MVLNNVKLAHSGQTVNIRISNGKIEKLQACAIYDLTATLQLYFDDAIVFPGLINSHDHLDFNLFPQLGNRTYSNYTEWGNYIHQQYKEEINQVLKAPAHLRVLWGIYKNLICGVTTVVNHGERLEVENPLIAVHEDTHDLHSAAFEKVWKLKLNNPLKRKLPVVIHTGEGTDKAATQEIDCLIRWNRLHRKMVGIHAVAMTTKQAGNFEAIVWCPESNYFLLDTTAPVNCLKQHTNIVFGTDSTLTSNWNIWDHIKMARKTGMLTDEELYSSLNTTAAKVWSINTGELTEGKDADLVIARRKSESTNLDAFYQVATTDLLLVIQQGNIRLIDQELFLQLAPHLVGKGFSLIKLGDSYKYVEGNIAELVESIKAYLPEAVFPFEVLVHLNL
jgi:cytosine/adenosine deaminase-related metal-dependent hydrolase